MIEFYRNAPRMIRRCPLKKRFIESYRSLLIILLKRAAPHEYITH
jgi:hypothetical protein